MLHLHLWRQVAFSEGRPLLMAVAPAASTEAVVNTAAALARVADTFAAMSADLAGLPPLMFSFQAVGMMASMVRTLCRSAGNAQTMHIDLQNDLVWGCDVCIAVHARLAWNNLLACSQH